MSIYNCFRYAYSFEQGVCFACPLGQYKETAGNVACESCLGSHVSLVLFCSNTWPDSHTVRSQLTMVEVSASATAPVR